jgi:hypothetical protein
MENLFKESDLDGACSTNMMKNEYRLLIGQSERDHSEDEGVNGRKY